MKNILNTLKRWSNWATWYLGGIHDEDAMWEIDGERSY